MTTSTSTAREYLRVSKDTSGRERSITEQHAENAAEASTHGWDLGDAYADVGSASRYATKPRGGYDVLVKDLRAGRFGADVLIIWEASRGSRKASEWLELVELCEERDVKIHVTSHHRTYDPRNYRDRKSLRDDASDSEFESDKTSERVTRSNGSNAKDGRPHGRTPFGYRRERWIEVDPETGKLVQHVEQVIDETEAKVVRELFDRVAGGHSLRSVARDFEARGVRTRSGKVFSPQHLRSLLTNPAYVRERVHVTGDRRKNGSGYVTGAKVETFTAAWPAIIDRHTWLTVRDILDAPERRTTRPGRAVHLLSMIARCDVCDGPLAGTNRGAEPQYQCHLAGHVRIGKAGLDDLVEAAVLAYLSRDDVAAELTHDDGNDAEVEAARLAVKEVRAELNDLADQVGSGRLSATLAARAEPAIAARLKAAEDRVAELETPAPLAGYVTPGHDVARRWEAAPMEVRREVVRLLLTPRYLGELRVTRSPTPGHAAPVEDRVLFVQDNA